MADRDEKPVSEETAEAKRSSCLLCGDDDVAAPLIPVRRRGRDEWVCVHCLPRLIHG